ncbi:general transcription factor II-I repeat domain-containing protein 2-like [Stegodyphus dumicola]|uniref:general transcription factor II-I repeat domain-containing protein 2-like n=1 Tax=Stegodyphus dumicola TaxID=202533 RepID=UPI0015ADD3B8|nr:general transcription factor II-I repeat domain-containing protein 2-like [Stegodyphus dumicola]
MGESTDAIDTAQVAIFIRGVDRDFTNVDELASVVQLKGTTRGTDLYSSLTQTLDKCNVDSSNISAITGGAKSMTGEKIGVTTLLKSDVKTSENYTKMTFYCIIHQENLCKKSFSNFEHVMNVVGSVVNFIEYK